MANLCSLQSSQSRNSSKHAHSLKCMVFSEFIKFIGMNYALKSTVEKNVWDVLKWVLPKKVLPLALMDAAMEEWSGVSWVSSYSLYCMACCI